MKNRLGSKCVISRPLVTYVSCEVDEVQCRRKWIFKFDEIFLWRKRRRIVCSKNLWENNRKIIYSQEGDEIHSNLVSTVDDDEASIEFIQKNIVDCYVFKRWICRLFIERMYEIDELRCYPFYKVVMKKADELMKRSFDSEEAIQSLTENKQFTILWGSCERHWL